MKVKVIRDYSGEEGEGPNKDVVAGRVLEVTEARGAHLIANRLAEATNVEASEAHLALTTNEQPVAPVERFPSGGITSVAPLNEPEKGYELTTEETPVIDAASPSAPDGKLASPPANKRARTPSNKAAPAAGDKGA